MKFHEDSVPSVDPQAVHSLTDFQRNAKSHVRQLKAGRNAALFTVNGRGAVVMMAPQTFSRLLQRLATLEETVAVQEGVIEMFQGKGRPLEEVERELRTKRGIGAGRKKSA